MAEFLRVLVTLVSFYCFSEIIVECAKRNTPGTWVDRFSLQGIDQMRHENAASLLHLLARYFAPALGRKHHAPFVARQITERLAEKQRGLFGRSRGIPRATGMRNI